MKKPGILEVMILLYFAVMALDSISAFVKIGVWSFWGVILVYMMPTFLLIVAAILFELHDRRNVLPRKIAALAVLLVATLIYFCKVESVI